MLIQTVVYLYHEILLNDKKEWTTFNDIDEFHKLVVWKKPYSYIYWHGMILFI